VNHGQKLCYLFVLDSAMDGFFTDGVCAQGNIIQMLFAPAGKPVITDLSSLYRH
jgi:hypothetical protein